MEGRGKGGVWWRVGRKEGGDRDKGRKGFFGFMGNFDVEINNSYNI